MIHELNKDLAVAQTIALITSYSFDLQGYTIPELISQWLTQYHPSWIRLATIEALYLGRYKVISIEQILQVWLRLGNPNTHFTHEFERLISRKLPRHLVNSSLESSENSIIEEKNNSLKLTDFSNTSGATNFTQEVNSQEESVFNMSDRSPMNDNNLESQELESDVTISEENSIYDSDDTLNLSLPESGDISQMQYHFPVQYQTPFSRGNGYPTPIHQFNPLPDVSPLYQKLKAVAQQAEEQEQTEEEE